MKDLKNALEESRNKMQDLESENENAKGIIRVLYIFFSVYIINSARLACVSAKNYFISYQHALTDKMTKTLKYGISPEELLKAQ